MLLTGGIGSGKSAVGRLLASWGATVVDADALAREVVGPGTPGLRAVTSEFGPQVLGGDGALDRAALATRVFTDRAALDALEAIVHPLVQRAAEKVFAAAPAGGVLVYEVPVPDTRDQGREGWVVVVVDAPESVRQARLRARGLDDEQITARMRQQPTRPEWLAMADVVIDNASDVDALRTEVAGLWRSLTGEQPPGR